MTAARHQPAMIDARDVNLRFNETTGIFDQTYTLYPGTVLGSGRAAAARRPPSAWRAAC
jgi:hypothetical protein